MNEAVPATLARIVIVDDHPIVRAGLAALIATQSDLEVCGQAEDADTALRLIESEAPHLAVIDLSLKDSNGLDLIKRLALGFGKVRILVSSMHDEAVYAERALNAGALGYINKQEATRNMLAAIRQVLQGQVYLSPRMSESLLHRMVGPRGDEGSDAVETLSDRELEVFRMIGHGMTSGSIADQLNLSPKTVQTYRQRIKQKLGIETAAELATRASRWVLEETA